MCEQSIIVSHRHSNVSSISVATAWPSLHHSPFCLLPSPCLSLSPLQSSTHGLVHLPTVLPCSTTFNSSPFPLREWPNPATRNSGSTCVASPLFPSHRKGDSQADLLHPVLAFVQILVLPLDTGDFVQALSLSALRRSPFQSSQWLLSHLPRRSK